MLIVDCRSSNAIYVDLQLYLLVNWQMIKRRHSLMDLGWEIL